jgi:hypothetical protein
MRVPPNIAPPISSFCPKLPAVAVGEAGCWIYVLDCRNAFRAFASVLIGVAVREVKKVAAGLEWWNARIGVDLNADFETQPTVEASLKGWRIANAILNDCGDSQSTLRTIKMMMLMAN